MAFFPQTPNSILIMRKTSDKIRLGDMLQDTSPVRLNTVKVRKNKERSGNSQSRGDSETVQLMQWGTLDWVPKQEEDINGKTDEIEIKSRISTCQ